MKGSSFTRHLPDFSTSTGSQDIAAVAFFLYKEVLHKIRGSRPARKINMDLGNPKKSLKNS